MKSTTLEKILFNIISASVADSSLEYLIPLFSCNWKNCFVSRVCRCWNDSPKWNVSFVTVMDQKILYIWKNTIDDLCALWKHNFLMGRNSFIRRQCQHFYTEWLVNDKWCITISSNYLGHSYRRLVEILCEKHEVKLSKTIQEKWEHQDVVPKLQV